MPIRHWSISHKLIAAFAVMIAILLLQAGFILNAYATLEDAYTRRGRGFVVLNQAVQIQTDIVEQMNAARAYTMAGNPRFRDEYDRKRQDLRTLAATLRATTQRAVTRQRIDRISAGIDRWQRDRIDPVLALAARADGRAEAQRRMQVDSLGPVRADIDALAQAQLTRNDDLTRMAVAAGRHMRIAMWIGGLSAIAAAMLLAWALTLGIARPIRAMTGAMKRLVRDDFDVVCATSDRRDEIGEMEQAVVAFRRTGIAKQAADRRKAEDDAAQQLVVDTVSANLSRLSDGDLTATIAVAFPPAYAALRDHFNAALDRLRGLIGTVSESTLAIRTGSDEIAQASEDLARRTETNAASLEQTAASVSRMDDRLRASATAAARTVERADQAIATVDGGRAVADEAVQAMGRVSESAKGIDSVIEGLDKIAFQTRVLAMNAAVEAGRAGDAGRGFAVVADLVSALAMRSEEEAKRAREQLTATQSDIITAVDAVQKVDGALSNISGDVAQVHELLATMASDNQAQSAAITQVSATIGSMDRATQQNAAMVEQTSAAARNLANEVGSLSDKAAHFTIESHRPTLRPEYFAMPVKPLPAAAIPALVVDGGNRAAF